MQPARTPLFLLLAAGLSLPAPAVFAITIEHDEAVLCEEGPYTQTLPTEVDGVTGAVNPTAIPIGGGAKNEETFIGAEIVNDTDELLDAIADAEAGDVIYLNPNGSFNLTYEVHPIVIPAGVTLASNRGRADGNGGYSPGAELYVTGNINSNRAIFEVTGNGNRFTGLRLRGPYHGVSNPAYEVRGINSTGANLQIDNSELSAWSAAAIYLRNAKQAHIHHNYIHHNYLPTMGYGVVLYEDADALIEANLFDHNRHSIAGDGDAGQSYEARYNIAQQHLNSHAFDMHGKTVNGTIIAGDQIYIHHNTVLATQDGHGQPHNLIIGVKIRGTPQSCAWVDHNAFAEPQAYAIGLENSPNPANLEIGDNVFNVSGLIAANGGAAEWVSVRPESIDFAQVHIADFNGDGRDDIFKTENGQWKIAYSGDNQWTVVATSDAPALSNLRFGDFNGDNAEDVFRIGATRWEVRYSGLGSWDSQTLTSSAFSLSQLRFGKFVGPSGNDNITDVFVIDGGVWKVSRSGTQPWQTINSLGQSVGNLRFGDFDGNGTTDVFYADGTQWNACMNNCTAWTVRRSSTLGVADLLFGDFNGDGNIDVLSLTSTDIQLSLNGNSIPQTINSPESGMTINNIGVGDFNGDGHAELLWNGKPDI